MNNIINKESKKRISLLARTHGHPETHLLIPLFAALIAATPKVLKKTFGQKNVKRFTEISTHVELTNNVPTSCDVSVGKLDLSTLNVECLF